MKKGHLVARSNTPLFHVICYILQAWQYKENFASKPICGLFTIRTATSDLPHEFDRGEPNDEARSSRKN